jgi:predicted methyltransferase
MFRRHNQLPCTAATLRRRVEAVRSYIGLESPILIVGDDDLQSLALAAEGFTDITVVEIDEAVTRDIAKAAQAHAGAITVIREDIGRIGALGRSFAAILMDPPVNIDGARAFLDGAVRAAGPGETTLFLNTHLLSYGEAGYGELIEVLGRHGFGALELRRAFSRYAIPRLPRAAVNALLRIVEPRISTSVHFFVSDLVVLRRAA